MFKYPMTPKLSYRLVSWQQHTSQDFVRHKSQLKAIEKVLESVLKAEHCGYTIQKRLARSTKICFHFMWWAGRVCKYLLGQQAAVKKSSLKFWDQRRIVVIFLSWLVFDADLCHLGLEQPDCSKTGCISLLWWSWEDWSHILEENLPWHGLLWSSKWICLPKNGCCWIWSIW